MGTWSASLYGNDTTSDVRDTYIGFLQDEYSNQEAYEKTMEEMQELIGDEEEALFWFALADTQWRVGRLNDEVKAKALEWIEKEGGLSPWLESASKGSGWKKTLLKLREKLEKPAPKEKKVTKPVAIQQNLWNVNDIYAYQFTADSSNANLLQGKYILLQKVSEGKNFFNEVVMRVHVYDKLFDSLPTLQSVENIRLLPFDYPARFDSEKNTHLRTNIDYTLCMSKLLSMWKKNQYPEDSLTYIGNKQGLDSQVFHKNRYVEMPWLDINSWLADLYLSWQGIQYDNIGDGVYKWLAENEK